MKQMMKKSFLMPLLAALLFSGAFTAPVAAQEADALQNLIPDDALGLIWVKSLGGFQSELKKLVASVDENAAEEVDIQELLALLELSDLGLDMTKPACFAMGPPEDEFSEPVPVMVLPCKDAKKAGAELNAMGYDSDAVVRGSYVAFAPIGTYTAGTKPNSLLNGLPGSDVVLRVNLGSLISTYRENVDMVLDMAAEEMTAEASREGPAAEAAIEPIIKFLGDVVDSSRMLDITLDIDNTAVDVACALTVGQGTPLAKGTAMGSGTVGSLAGYLPSSHPIAMLLSFDMQGLSKFLEPLYGAMEKELPEDQREGFKAMMSAQREMMKSLGNDLAFSMGVGENGFELVEIFTADDPVALMSKWQEVMSGDLLKSMGLSATYGELQKTAAGSTRQKITMKIDWEKLMAWAGAPSGAGDELAPMMQALFGSEDLVMHTATMGKHAVIALGGDTLLQQSLAGMQRGATGVLKQTLGKAGKAPAFVLSADLRGVMKAVKAVATRMGMGDEVPDLGDGPPVGIGFYAGRTGLVFRGGVHADVGEIAKLFAPFIPR